MPTTGGNAVFANSHAASDATVIQRLREAGAIIFIKTNMDEMAQATVGLSTVGGQILNPYDLTKGPGGSSGGTGVAVRCRLRHGWPRHRNRRVGPQPRQQQHARRHRPVARPGEPRRRDSDFLHAGSHWSAGEDGGRCRDPADPHARLRRGRLDHHGEFRAAGPQLHHVVVRPVFAAGGSACCATCSARGMWCRPATR